MNWVLVGNLIGYVAIVHSLTLYLFRKRKHIMLMRILGETLWGINNLLTGLYTGALVFLLAICRDFVYLMRPYKKWADSFWWVALFLVLSMISPIVTWAGPVSILPATGCMFSVVGGYSKKTIVIRLCLFPSEALWLVYGILMGNLPLIISQALLMVSATVGIVIDLVSNRRAHKDLPAATDSANPPSNQW
jgi:hypothetical protein